MGPHNVVNVDFREPEYTEDDVLLRRAFVQEYMHCRNAYDACLKLGFLQPYAEDWAKRFMHEGLVRRLIGEAEKAQNPEEQYEIQRRRYVAWGEREANYFGPGASHAARVSAIKFLTELEGMSNAGPQELEVTHKGGVMQVPGLMSPDSWGDLAAESQRGLKESVRD